MNINNLQKDYRELLKGYLFEPLTDELILDVKNQINKLLSEYDITGVDYNIEIVDNSIEFLPNNMLTTLVFIGLNSIANNEY